MLGWKQNEVQRLKYEDKQFRGQKPAFCLL